MSSFAPNRPPHRRLVRGLLCATLCLPLWTQAADLSAQRDFRIAPGTLADAMTSFAAQSGVPVAFDPALLAGRRSAGLQGRHSTAEGFDILLRGAGLRVVPAGNGYALERIGQAAIPEVAALAPVRVTASLPGTTEGSRTYATQAMSTATKLTLSPRETPQSVSVVTRQQIEDQGMNTLEDAMTSSPGVTLRRTGSNRPFFYARGFSVSNISYDGLPTSVENFAFDVIASADLAIYDRVEIVRGATGLMQGSGNPSAAINLVRKRPTREFQGYVQGSVGSWDQRRVEADLAGPLVASGHVRGRLVTAWEGKDSFMDAIDERKKVFYGALEADLGDRTLLSGSVNVQDSRRHAAWVLLPALADGSDLGLPRSRALWPSWGQHDTDNTFYNLALDHRFANGWKARAAATHLRGDMDFIGTTFLGLVRPDGSGLSISRGANYVYENRQTSLDLFASGPFELLGRRHELVLGADWRRSSFEPWGDTEPGTVAIPNVRTWDASTLPRPEFTLAKQTWNSASRQSSAYATARLDVADPVTVIAGARLSRWRHVGNNGATRYGIDDQITPYLGVLVDVSQRHTVYASYTSIFQPQNAYTASASLLDPIEGKSYEVGLKSEFADGQVNSAVAVFRTDQTNRAMNDLSGPSPCPFTGALWCSVAAGKVRAQGVDAELSGSLTPRLELSAGYTYTRTRFVNDLVNAGKVFDPLLPRHILRLTGTYRLGEAWTVGATLQTQSRITNAGTNALGPWLREQKGYVIANLMAQWQLDKHWTLRANLNNVFDKRYYQTIGSPTSGNRYGDPRNLLVTARYRF